MQLISEMEPDARGDMAARTVVMFDMFQDKRLTMEHRRSLLIAIDFRLAALSRAIASGAARGFTLPGSESGMEMVTIDALRCAANEPLIEIDGQPAFDPRSFQARLLIKAEPQGLA